jgi:hypothetical protein
MNIEFSSSENPKHNKRCRRERPTYKKGLRSDGARVFRAFPKSGSRSKYLPHVGNKQQARLAKSA